MDSPKAVGIEATPVSPGSKPIDATAQQIEQPQGETTSSSYDGVPPPETHVPMIRLDDAQPAQSRHPTWFTGALH